jgi:hypothetical protein
MTILDEDSQLTRQTMLKDRDCASKFVSRLLGMSLHVQVVDKAYSEYSLEYGRITVI